MNQWKLINHTFKFREGDTDEKGGCTFIGGTWKDITTDDLFKDRKVGLIDAIQMTNPGDIIAVLGKGNEEYQDIKGQLFFHSDKEIIMSMQ